jgi:hypothetical protein
MIVLPACVRSLLAGLIVSLLAAACSSSTDEASNSTEAPPTTAAPTTTENLIEGSGVSTTTVPEESAPTMTEPPTTMTPPTTLALEPACQKFVSLGYESRKASVEGNDELRNTLNAQCPDLIRRLDEATALEGRAAAIGSNSALTSSNPTCTQDEAGNALVSVTLTNQTNERLGAVYSGLLAINGETPQSTAAPFIVTGIEAGESIELGLGLGDVADRQFDCRLEWRAFLDDSSDIDAAPVVLQDTNAELDPIKWLPDLIRTELESVGSGDPNRAAELEDIRSFGYQRIVVSTSLETSDGDYSGRTYLVCEQTVVRSEELMAFYYVRLVPGEFPSIRAGAFRSGSDGVWRWLMTAMQIAPNESHDGCIEDALDLAASRINA